MGMFESAARRRRAAEIERRLAELDEWDRRYGLGGAPPGHHSVHQDTTWRHHSPDGERPLRAFDPTPAVVGHRAPRPRRRTGRWLLALLVVTLGVGTYLYPERADVAKQWLTAAGRSILGVPASEPGLQASAGRDIGPGEPRPLPPPDPQADPMEPARGETPAGESSGGGIVEEVVDHVLDAGVTWGWQPPHGRRVLPPVEATTSGSHAFLQTQPGTDVPVGFSPCGPVEVVINPAGAPWGYTDIVTASLQRLTEASGLDLVLVGETDETWQEEPREMGSPVLVSWSDPETVPGLAGGYAGLGGATYVVGHDGRMWHSGGQVVLDATDLVTYEQHSAVLDHELGHVLGLDHVDDVGELMAPRAVQTSFGPGDLAGLAALGAIACPGDA